MYTKCSRVNLVGMLLLLMLLLQSKRIVDHAQFLAQGLFPVTTNADEVRNV